MIKNHATLFTLGCPLPSVGTDDEPWIHALLLAVGRRTGLATLINTSFNTKGLVEPTYLFPIGWVDEVGEPKVG